MRDTPPGAAAIYCRISHDPSGERLGVNRQQLDCEQEAKRRGWTVAEVYVDDDISAFDRRKVRPEYQRLLTDISGGVRDGVMTWRLDRLHRQPQELEEFIVICDKHHVALATVTGDIDLSTSHGRLVARTWGAFAAHESEVRGERLRRAARDRAARGLMPPGRIRCYGYDRSGKVVVPAEASVIREGARRLRLGDSLRSIAADFNRRGIPSAMDCQWQAGALRGVLMSPRIAGFSTYHGEAVGRGAWQRILSVKESDRVRAILMDPERRQTNGPLGHYLLRRIITCARCKHFLVMGRSPNGRVSYNCRSAPGNKRCGTISATAENVEWFIFERICQRLESRELREWLNMTQLSDTRWKRARAALDRAQRQLEQLAQDHARGAITRSEWRAARPAVYERVQRSRALLVTESAHTIISEYVGDTARLREDWPSLPHTRQRALVAALIKEVILWPARDPGPTAMPTRVQIWWQGEVRPRAPRTALRLGIAERRTAGAYATCSIPGCAEPYRSNGLCNVHLCRVIDKGTTGSAERIRHAWYRGATCLEDACQRRATSAGRCDHHYRKWKEQDESRPKCATEGCNRRAGARDWCQTHYYGMWRRGEIPLTHPWRGPRIGKPSVSGVEADDR